MRPGQRSEENSDANWNSGSQGLSGAAEDQALRGKCPVPGSRAEPFAIVRIRRGKTQLNAMGSRTKRNESTTEVRLLACPSKGESRWLIISGLTDTASGFQFPLKYIQVRTDRASCQMADGTEDVHEE